jgi:hypothetical protein
MNLKGFEACGNSNNAFLNVGSPIWSMDFSPIFEANHEVFTVLALSTSSYKNPTTPCIPSNSDLLNMNAHHDSTIQLWKVTPSSLNTSVLVLFLIQKVSRCIHSI